MIAKYVKNTFIFRNLKCFNNQCCSQNVEIFQICLKSGKLCVINLCFVLSESPYVVQSDNMMNVLTIRKAAIKNAMTPIRGSALVVDNGILVL